MLRFAILVLVVNCFWTPVAGSFPAPKPNAPKKTASELIIGKWQLAEQAGAEKTVTGGITWEYTGREIISILGETELSRCPYTIKFEGKKALLTIRILNGPDVRWFIESISEEEMVFQDKDSDIRFIQKRVP